MKDYLYPIYKYNSIAGTQWDAVNATLGDNWRMPTYENYQELMSADFCTWSWTTENGVKGYKVTSKKNENSIFLPASKPAYWTSSPHHILDEAQTVYSSYIYGEYAYIAGQTECRMYAHPIRPVYVEPKPEPTPVPEYVDLGLKSGIKWATCNLGATSPQDAGDYYGWGCTEPYAADDNVNWAIYFQKLGGTGTSSSDCATDKDPLRHPTAPGETIDIEGTEYDAARVKLGENWRMPNDKAFRELLCTDSIAWEWKPEMKAFKLTSKINGNYIYLPATGHRNGVDIEYWGDDELQYWAAAHYFGGDYGDFKRKAATIACYPEYENCGSWNGMDRFYGIAIRPIYVGADSEPELVDLGLSVKWATCNLGASKPEEYGDYYGWGCTEPYKEGENVDWPLYFQYIGGTGTSEADCGLDYDKDPLCIFTSGWKYESIAGTEWDAVYKKFGGDWRMPTNQEMNELLNNCTWALTTENGVTGYKVTGKNGNSIFLPYAGAHMATSRETGSGKYWSSMPAYDMNSACYIELCEDEGEYHKLQDMLRYIGFSIRPVHP